MARCGRAPDCPPVGCWAEDCCVTQARGARPSHACPTCGSAVEIVGGDEGTMSYRPWITVPVAQTLSRLVDELDSLHMEIDGLCGRLGMINAPVSKRSARIAVAMRDLAADLRPTYFAEEAPR